MPNVEGLEPHSCATVTRMRSSLRASLFFWHSTDADSMWIGKITKWHPNRETAKRIQARILECGYFLFLATANSMQSRWCPWEIGYADGKKDLDDIFLIRTMDSQGTYGNEYLELYRRIDYSDTHKLGAWLPSQTHGILVESL